MYSQNQVLCLGYHRCSINMHWMNQRTPRGPKCLSKKWNMEVGISGYVVKIIRGQKNLTSARVYSSEFFSLVTVLDLLTFKCSTTPHSKFRQKIEELLFEVCSSVNTHGSHPLSMLRAVYMLCVRYYLTHFHNSMR